MDLIRQILFAVEKLPYTGNSEIIEVDDYPMDELQYHLKLVYAASTFPTPAGSFSTKTTNQVQEPPAT